MDAQPADTPDAPENAQKGPSGLTSEQAEILLRGDLRNLAKKVQQGRTLSASERNLLNSVLKGGEGATASFAANQVELASALGVSRKTIQRARKKDGNPGVKADGRWDVNAWREFLRLIGTLDGDSGEEELDPTREKARNILLKNEKLEAELAILKRQWMPVTEVERIGGDLGTAIRKVVGTIHLAAPTVVGVSVAEAESRLKELESEILDQLHALAESIGDWKEARESAP